MVSTWPYWGKSKDRRERSPCSVIPACHQPKPTYAGPRSAWFWISPLQESFRKGTFLIWKVTLSSVYRALPSPLSPSNLLKNHYSVFWSIAKFLLVGAFLMPLTQEWSSDPQTLSFPWEHLKFLGTHNSSPVLFQITYLIFAFFLAQRRQKRSIESQTGAGGEGRDTHLKIALCSWVRWDKRRTLRLALLKPQICYFNKAANSWM